LAAGISSFYFYYRNESKPAQPINFFNTAVIAENGQRSKVILPDSSLVWLNSGSQLTYKSNFGHTNRDIKLTGQAFFQVAENKKLPFIVSCNELKVKVLGTRFDVEAYPNDENIRVALQTGNVELVHSKKANFHYQLTPGEMAQFNNYSEKVVIYKVNMDRITAWTDGILYFNDSPMKEVLIRLERKYNIDIEVKNSKIYESVFTATIKNETLDEIFRSIDYSCSVSSSIIRGIAKDAKTKVIVR
jgi:ferric-dicitrate binding protein FerR (iron transport regulator)